MKRAAFLAAGLAGLGAAFAAGQATLPFQSPAGKRARATYDAAIVKADKVRKAAVAEAARDYAIVLQHEIELATKAGKLDDAIALRNEAEAVAGAIKASPVSIEGTWQIRFSNGATRWYVIHDGRAAYADVTRASDKASVGRIGTAMTIDFGDGKMDVVTAADGALLFERYAMPDRKLLCRGKARQVMPTGTP